MSDSSDASQTNRRYWPLAQLVLARLREFYREPEAIFWVYGFPILMVVALGIAFRNQPVERIRVDLQDGPFAARLMKDLSPNPKFVAEIKSAEACRLRLRMGKTDVVVIAEAPPPTADAESTLKYDYLFDPTRPESVLARNAVDDQLQRAAGRKDKILTSDAPFEEPGGRYIDFLVPGLLGMSLMGGGLWGLGFVTVDMRIRKLLKRFLATPMKKSQFLGGLIISRLLFMVPEVLILLLFSRWFFDVIIQGSLFAVVVLILVGAFAFAGLGLLVASRARTLEAVSGWMNAIMLPMWVASGIFFSSERFPDYAQPVVKALPLTHLNNALRAVMLEGATLQSQWAEVAILAAWGLITFVLALRWFRWN